jgi:hypothetical protein
MATVERESEIRPMTDPGLLMIHRNIESVTIEMEESDLDRGGP